MTQLLGATNGILTRFTRTAAGSYVTSLIAACAAIGGCATEGYYAHRPQAKAPSDAVLPWVSEAPRTLPMFEGDTGRIATWYDLMEGIAWADVICIGETHTDMIAHSVEAAIVEDTIASFPGTVVSMEMFERDHQAVLDEYLAGQIDVATLIERAKTRRWEFKELPAMTWETSYQPIVDAAKVRGSHVVAANAPREFTRIAKNDGYDALRALPPEQQLLFDVPKHLDGRRYRHRFDETMSKEKLAPSDRRSEYDNIFRSQQLWDATMAASIARALENGAPKVVHVVGQFHVEWRGGIVGQLRDFAPNAKVLVVTVAAADGTELAESDRGRADIVMYSGEREEPVEPEAAPKETTTETPAAVPADLPTEQKSESNAPPAAASPHSAPKPPLHGG